MEYLKIMPGDAFSEISYLTVKEVRPNEVIFKHLTTGKEVTIGKEYVLELLHTANQYNEVKKVTKEDKRDGTPGIRTVFKNIGVGKMCTFVFQKQDKEMSKKDFNALVAKRTADAHTRFEKAKAGKKSTLEVFQSVVQEFIDNPVTNVIEGEMRTLIGYKIDFESTTGLYRCIDVNLPESDNIRPVNINTLTKVIVDNILYEV